MGENNFLKFTLNNVHSPWDGEFWIGFVADLVDNYLGIKSAEHLTHQSGPLSICRTMSINDRNCKRTIYIERIFDKNDRPTDNYIINGFPHHADFEKFKKEVQQRWNNYYKRMEKERDAKTNLGNAINFSI